MKAGRSAPYAAHAFNSGDAEARARQDFTARRPTSHTRPAIKPRATPTTPAPATTAKKTPPNPQAFFSRERGAGLRQTGSSGEPKPSLVFFHPAEERGKGPGGHLGRCGTGALPARSLPASPPGGSSPLPPRLGPPPALGMPVPVPGNRGGSRTGGHPPGPGRPHLFWGRMPSR